MKKILLIVAAISLTAAAWAQKSKMRDARDYLSDNNYRKAIPTLDDVVANDDTKENAEAWYLRGFAYMMAAQDSTSGIPNAAEESYKSLMKSIAVKPDYPKDINAPFYNLAVIYYRKGAAAYNNKDYATAYNAFTRVLNISRVNGGQRFATDANFGNITPSALSLAGYSAYYANKDQEAITLLNEIRNNPSNTDSEVYGVLIDVYQRQKKEPEALAVISEGRKKFPGNQLLRNLELNHYINSGQQDVLLNKLVDAAAAEPNNKDLQFNLGNVYERAAFPKDEKGKLTARPANFDVLFGKAEAAYTKALSLDPANPEFNYNAGVIYYEKASAVTSEMNAIEGFSAAEKKKYDALNSERNGYFDKAAGYFEKAYAGLDAMYAAKGAEMKSDDKVTYQNVMIGLREIYSRRDRAADASKIKAKIDALK